MRIHRLRLTNYRGLANAEVNLKADGVTILEGPNESGKSCYIEALDHLLEDLDSSKSQDIKDLRPAGRDQWTEVEADIEIGTYRFTYRKRWNKTPETELKITRPRIETLASRPAHERVQEILAANMDTALYKAVRITQGTGFDQPDLPTESTLTRALDAAAGGTPITAREADLIAKAEAEYKSYWTETGRPKAIVTETDERTRQAQATEQELAAKIREADADAARHDDVTRSFEDLSQRRAGLEAAAQEWEAKRKDVETQQEGLRTLEALSTAAKSTSANAQGAHEARLAAILELDRLDKDHTRVKGQFDEAAPALAATRATADGARTAADQAERKAVEARNLAKLRKNDSDVLHYDFDLRLLRERRTKATQAQAKRVQADAILAGNKLTDDRLDAIRKADQKVAVAQARLRDASPKLSITAKKALEAKLDGKRLTVAAGKTHHVQVPNAIKLDLGETHIEVRAGTSLDDLQEGHKDAQKTLYDLLEEHHVADVAAAIKAHEARTEAEAAKKRAQSDMKDALRSDKPLAFKNLEEMDAKIGEVDARIKALLAGRPADPPRPRSKEDASRHNQQAQAAAETAGRTAADERAKAEAAAGEVSKLAEQQAGRGAKVEHAAEALRLANERLAAARNDADDGSLSLEASAKARDLADAKAKLAAAQEAIQRTDPETVLDRAKTSRDAVKRLDAEAAELSKEQNTIGGRLQVHAQQGFHEHHQRAEGELEAAKAAASSLHRRADTARVLYTLLSRHRTEAQRRYVGPLRERIIKLGRYVYGETFDVDLDETLTITQRTLDGVPLPYRSLSKGAKEQLSLLLRLACALTVTRDGTGVPILIDDALGYTDPTRLAGMGAVLDRAGRECQVVVLTCTPDRYQTVSSALVRRM